LLVTWYIVEGKKETNHDGQQQLFNRRNFKQNIKYENDGERNSNLLRYKEKEHAKENKSNINDKITNQEKENIEEYITKENNKDYFILSTKSNRNDAEDDHCFNNKEKNKRWRKKFTFVNKNWYNCFDQNNKKEQEEKKELVTNHPKMEIIQDAYTVPTAKHKFDNKFYCNKNDSNDNGIEIIYNSYHPFDLKRNQLTNKSKEEKLEDGCFYSFFLRYVSDNVSLQFNTDIQYDVVVLAKRNKNRNNSNFTNFCDSIMII